MNSNPLNLSKDRKKIELHVHDIMNSNALRKSAQLKSLLKFLVSYTLDGKDDRLKGYTIGVEALNRSADFDPQSDPIVRVQARRLRDALHQFYQEEGRDSEIEVSIEKGGYKPIFRRREASAPDPAVAPAPAPQSSPPVAAQPRSRAWTWGIGLGVLALAAGLGVILAGNGTPADKPATSRLALVDDGQTPASTSVSTSPAEAQGAPRKFDSYRNRPNMFLQASKTRPVSAADIAAAAEIAARYRLVWVGHASQEVSEAPEHPVPDSLLFDVEIGECEACAVPSLEVSVFTRPRRDIIYSMTFPIDPANRQRTLVRMMQAVVSMDGPIMIHLRRIRETIPRALACLGDVYFYAQTFSQEVRQRMRVCVDDYRASKEADPGMEQAAAFRYLDSYWFLEDPHGSLTRALEASKRAIELSPTFAHAHVLRSMVLAASGEVEQALRAAEHAFELNPYDDLTTFNLAARMLNTGQAAKARDLLEAINKESIAPPIWITTYLGVVYLIMDDFTALAGILPQLRGSTMPLANVVLVIAESRSADGSLGQQALTQLKSRYPFLTLKYASRVYLGAVFRNPDIARKITSAFEAALAELQRPVPDTKE
jgi:tetratricopeptide (TPR) repeat protein